MEAMLRNKDFTSPQCMKDVGKKTSTAGKITEEEVSLEEIQVSVRVRR